MRTFLTLAAAAACALAASAASAAPTITGVSVQGSGTAFKWSTAPSAAQDTLFVAPGSGVGVSAVVNPSNNFTSVGLGTADAGGDYDFTIYGDGYPTTGLGSGATKSAPNSDSLYTVTVTLKDGSKTGMLTGTWSTLTNTFVNTSPSFTGSTGVYQIDGFDWGRQLKNYVGSRSSSTSSKDAGGALRDYRGDLALTAGAVPEPTTWALLILGFGGIGGALRMRRRRDPVAATA